LGGARADSGSGKYVDVTTDYIQNPGFEETLGASGEHGWTYTNANGTTTSAHSGNKAANVYSNSAVSSLFNQKQTLPAGKYRMSVWVNGVVNANSDPNYTKFYVAFGGNDQKVVYYTKEGWQQLSCEFELTSAKEVTFGFWCKDIHNYWFHADDFTLEKYYDSYPSFSDVITDFDFNTGKAGFTTDPSKGWVCTFDDDMVVDKTTPKWFNDGKTVIIESGQNHIQVYHIGKGMKNQKIYQTIKGLPAGNYYLRVAAGIELPHNPDGTPMTETEAGANLFIKNAKTDELIGSQSVTMRGKNCVNWYSVKFTPTSINDEFTIGLEANTAANCCLDIDHFMIEAEVPKTEVSISVAALSWGTFVCPFEVDLDETEGVDGLYAYPIHAEDISSNVLTLKEANRSRKIYPNNPVLLYNSNQNSTISATFSGEKIPATNDLKNGLLTGVLDEAIVAPKGSYVLQNHGDVIGFYRVVDATPKVNPNRAYLTIPANSSTGAKALYFDTSSVTGIEKVEVEDNAGKTVRAYYTIGGTRISTPQKGVNIVQFTDGSTKKMILK